MTDEFCQVHGAPCRHCSRTLRIKEVCNLRTRKVEKVTSYGEAWCGDYQEFISRISHCIHHKPRVGQQLLIIDGGVA